MNEICSPNDVPKKISIGEEFIEFAEQYYQMEKLYKQEYETPKQMRESCPYSFIRNLFIKKINKLISDKLGI